jgi:hypothetical protein
MLEPPTVHKKGAPMLTLTKCLAIVATVATLVAKTIDDSIES